MFAVQPYLNFMGRTEEAFNFYKTVFGGDFATLQRFSDTPHSAEMAAADREKIMHVALPIGENTVLMGTDMLESMGHSLKRGNNVSLSLHPDSRAEAERLFNGLAEGGDVTLPLQDMFWGAYFGTLTDQFGIQWMVNCDQNESA